MVCVCSSVHSQENNLKDKCCTKSGLKYLLLLLHLAVIGKNTTATVSHIFYKTSKDHFTDGKGWHKAHFHCKEISFYFKLEKFNTLSLNGKCSPKEGYCCLLRYCWYLKPMLTCQPVFFVNYCQQKKIKFIWKWKHTSMELQSSDIILPWVSDKNLF